MKQKLANLYFFNFLLFLFIFSFLIYFSKHGFDFTDEGYYLNNIKYFKIYKSSLTLFGFFYQMIGFWAKDNIIFLRYLNLLLTTFASFGLCYFFLIQKLDRMTLRLTYLLISFSISVLSFLNFDRFLITPNYNTLNFQALLLATFGLILLNRNYKLGVLLLATGGWLSFLAKPTTALALGFLAFLQIFFFQKNRLKLIISSLVLFSFLMVGTAFYLDGSLLSFASRYKLGFFFMSLLDGGHDLKNLFRFDTISISYVEMLLILAVFFCLISFGIFLIRAKNLNRKIWSLNIFLSFFFILFLINFGSKELFYKLPKTLFLISISISILVLGYIISRKNRLMSFSANSLFWGIYFLFLPFAYALGSNTNLWIKSTHASIFWILGAISFFSNRVFIKFLRFFSIIVTLIQLLVILYFCNWMISPYRQEPYVLTERIKKEVGVGKSTLYLNKNQVRYLTFLEGKFLEHGFLPEDPIIDLTGQSPGVIYALGGKAIGQPWLIGGYKGSQNYVFNSLKQFSINELKSSWILIEPSGPRSISPDVLNQLGLKLNTDFEYVGSIILAPGLGGNKIQRKQDIYKPIKRK